MRPFIFFNIACCYLLLNDKLCDPSGNSLWPYSGIRFYKNNKLKFSGKFQNFLLMAFCKHGKNHLTLYNNNHPQGVHINWNSTWCFNDGLPSQSLGFPTNSATQAIYSQNTCYKLIRLEKVFNQKLSLYTPYSLVGGLFQCHSQYIPNSFNTALEINNLDCHNHTLVAPLFADNMYHQFMYADLSKLSVQYIIPVLYTKSTAYWDNQSYNINEIYPQKYRQLVSEAHMPLLNNSRLAQHLTDFEKQLYSKLKNPIY